MLGCWLGGGHLRERTYFGGGRACRHDLSHARAGHAVQLLGFGPETCADLCRVWGERPVPLPGPGLRQPQRPVVLVLHGRRRQPIPGEVLLSTPSVAVSSVR